MKFVGNFTTAMKEFAEAKLEKLNTFDINNATVTYKKIKDDFKVEISLGSDIRASQSGEDFYTLVNQVVEKLEGQIRRYRTSTIFRKRHIHESEDNSEYEDNEISREKLVLLESLTVNEAIESMEALSHTFFVYKDIDRSENTCIVYKREDGSYGVIETR